MQIAIVLCVNFRNIASVLRTTVMHSQPQCFCFPLSAFLGALPHLRLHVNLLDEDADSRSVIGSLLGLMEDPDPAVRIRLSQSVRFLLPESSGQSEQSSLSEVSSSWGRHSCSDNHSFLLCFILFLKKKEK